MNQGEAVVKAGEVRTDIIGQRRTIDGNCYEAELVTAEKYPPGDDNYEVIVYLAPMRNGLSKTKKPLDVFIASPRC